MTIKERNIIFEIYNKFYTIIDDQPEMYEWFRLRMSFTKPFRRKRTKMSK